MLETARTSALHSTVTPTASSLSTTRPNLISGSLTTAMVREVDAQEEPGFERRLQRRLFQDRREVIARKRRQRRASHVGHSFIKGLMADNNAVFGGEHSGHYYFRDNFFADSGIIAAMIVLGMLSSSDQPLSELRRPFDRYAASGEINTEVVRRSQDHRLRRRKVCRLRTRSFGRTHG